MGSMRRTVTGVPGSIISFFGAAGVRPAGAGGVSPAASGVETTAALVGFAIVPLSWSCAGFSSALESLVALALLTFFVMAALGFSVATGFEGGTLEAGFGTVGGGADAATVEL